MSQWPPADEVHCWSVPIAANLEEMGKVLQNRQQRQAQQIEARRRTPAALTLSGGELRAAYAAGLLAGWSETGNRPDFHVVTAIGVSAIIAPFAFIGPEADEKLADLFNCSAENWGDVARRAGTMLDAAVLEKIARKHDAGGRLFIAIPGTPARSEVVWDIGRIAASRDPQAARDIAAILLASADLVTSADPQSVKVPAGFIVRRNWTFRQTGAGEAFLSPEKLNLTPAVTYLIHNGAWLADESREYAILRQNRNADNQPGTPIVPAYDLAAGIAARRGAFRFIAMKPFRMPAPETGFGMPYLRGLFLRSYREARMGPEWQETLPGVADAAAPDR